MYKKQTRQASPVPAPLSSICMGLYELLLSGSCHLRDQRSQPFSKSLCTLCTFINITHRSETNHFPSLFLNWRYIIRIHSSVYLRHLFHNRCNIFKWCRLMFLNYCLDVNLFAFITLIAFSICNWAYSAKPCWLVINSCNRKAEKHTDPCIYDINLF